MGSERTPAAPKRLYCHLCCQLLGPLHSPLTPHGENDMGRSPKWGKNDIFESICADDTIGDFVHDDFLMRFF